ncbi:MAG TPA: alpha/beta family hydrolase [Acidimicrobiales bacterium]|nr:alpha/beta family hydrolase [Acidimicrobiales bacterium]
MTSPRRRGLLLAPGASAGRDQPALVAIDEAAAGAGYAVERMDFPYRLAGRRAPDKPPVLVEAVREAAAGLAAAHGVAPGRIAMGGRSMGGRICSMAAAAGLPCLALVLVSYPLHPPGRPDRLRVDHFPALTVPCLFVSGTRDAFATPTELEGHTTAIPGPVSHVWLDGGDHGLRRRDAAVAVAVASWLAPLGIG